MTFCRKVNRPTENETVRRKSTKKEREKESEVKIIKLYLSIKVLPSLGIEYACALMGDVPTTE